MTIEVEEKSYSAAEDARSRVVLVAAGFTAVAAILALITSYLQLHP